MFSQTLKSLILVATTVISASAQTSTKTVVEFGGASIVSDANEGRETASGEVYRRNLLTCNHRTLPYGTILMVTREDNGKSVKVKVNDRGPFAKGQIVQLSKSAALALGIKGDDIRKVRIEAIGNPYSSEIVSTQLVLPKETEALATTTSKPAPATNCLNAREVSSMETKGLYKIQVLKLEAKNWGVQIASYTSYDAVLEQVGEFQKKSFKNLLVYTTTENNAPVYKVILGPFLDKATADSYRGSLEKKHKTKGFVLDLATLN